MTDSGTGNGWGWILAYGIMLIVIGALALVEPLATGFATGLLLAWLLLASGVLAVVAGFSGRSWRNRWLDIVSGLAWLLLGGLILWNPIAGALSLVLLLGLWLVASGVIELAAAFRGARHRGWLILLGGIDIVVGAVLLFAGPAAALTFLAAAIGISFLFRGFLLAAFALRLRGA